MTAFLAQRVTSSPQLQRVLGASTSNLGRQIGTTSPTNTSSGRFTNTGVYFQGALYRMNTAGVWRSTDDGVTQTLVFVPTPAVYSLGDFTGPYVVYDSAGIPHLAVSYMAVTIFVHHVFSSLTGLPGSWSAPINAAAGSAGGFPVVYRGTLTWYSQSNSSFYQYNPSAGSAASFTAGFNTDYVYLVVWDDILYSVGAGTTFASPFRLSRLAGGVTTNVLSILASTTKACAAWVDQTTNDLIVIVRDFAGLVWKAYSITPALVQTDRTATMLTGGVLATLPGTAKVVGVFYDQEANPGGAPVISLLIAGDNIPGASVSQYRYNGVSTLMGAGGGTPNDSGGDVDFSWPDKIIGGERYFSPRFVGVDGAPAVTNTGKGALGVGVTRRKFKLIAPRSQLLTTLGGAGTYDLSTTPLASTPLQSGFATIRGVIGGIVHSASDLVATGVLAAPTTTIAAGSNGVNVNTFAGAGVLNVASTGLSTLGPNPTYPSAGTLSVATGSGPQIVTYTGITATTFTGCTSAGAGVMATGGAVVGGLLPSPGTIIYASGAMTGTTGTLDAASQVEALYNGGTAKNEWYRSLASNEYPGSTTKAPLTLPTSGTISADVNITCLADGSEQQVSVGMSGFTPGDRVSIAPRATP